MVNDISSGSSSSNPYYLTAVGNTLYFAAIDGTNGRELWTVSGGSGSGSGSSSTSAFAYANDKISNGNQHTCAIADNGSLYCWGLGYYGQLGHGAYTHLYAPSTTPLDLGAGRMAVAVASGWHHSCAILDNGSLFWWGMG